METEKKSDLVFIKDERIDKDVPEAQKSALPVELILDKTISCVSGLTKRQCRQLENVGFHTVCALRRLFETYNVIFWLLHSNDGLR